MTDNPVSVVGILGLFKQKLDPLKKNARKKSRLGDIFAKQLLLPTFECSFSNVLNKKSALNYDAVS